VGRQGGEGGGEKEGTGSRRLSPQKMEALSCLRINDSDEMIDGDQIMDGDRMSDHDTGGEEEQPDPRPWCGNELEDGEDPDWHLHAAVERAQARRHDRAGAETPPLPTALETQIRTRSSGVVLDSGASPVDKNSAGGRRGGGARSRGSKPTAPKKVVVNVHTQAKTFRVLVTPNDTWAHLCALVQAEMGFRDPPQLSCDGWTREPKPFLLIKDLPGMTEASSALLLRWPADFASGGGHA
jgi:hypothetical protein